MTNTRIKLEEARYFLFRMIEEVANREPFKYNLSAFLAAGRSVTLIMQKEFSETPEFTKWYERKQSQMDNDTLLQLMNRKRVMTIHQKPIKPYGHIDVVTKSTVAINEHVVAVLTNKNGTVERIEHKQAPPSPPAKEKTEVKYRWFFVDIPDQDIITLLQEYIAKLENLVKECEDKFAI